MRYAAIIGLNPSKGARSPDLWNSVFSHYGHNIKMVPIDVKKNDLKSLFMKLQNDKYFIGGAIAEPYKKEIKLLLKSNVSKEVKKIGAVNCIFRDKNKKLFGINTDGEASLLSFEKKFGKIKDKKIVLFGLGGAGIAVATYFSNLKNSKLICITRKKSDIKFCKKIKAKWVHLKFTNKYIINADILINCTNLGSNLKKNNMIVKKDLLGKLSKNTVIYDIIYNPRKTLLINESKKLNLSTLNGLDMNLYQAVIAYNKTAPYPKNKKTILKVMQSV